MIACLLLPSRVEGDLLLPALAEFTPAVEANGVGYFLDLGNLADRQPAELLDQLNGAVRRVAAAAPRLGLAAGKFPAQMAAAALGPGRGLVIVPGCEAGFLRPLPVAALPLDEELARQFDLLGLHRLGQLADLPAGAVLSRFGRRGRRLQQLARGQDTRPVAHFQRPPVETLRLEPETPLTRRDALARWLDDGLAQLADRLRADHRLCGAIELRLTLTDGTVRRERIALREAGQETALLQRALAARLARLELSAGVCALQLTLTALTPATGQQPVLFGPPQAGHWQAHLPDLLARFGPGRFYTVELGDPEARLPEQRFRLDEVEG